MPADLPALEPMPEQTDAAFQEGWALLQKGEPDRAIRVIQSSSVSLEKKHVAFALAFMQKNRLALARLQFDKALELNPDQYDSLWGLFRINEMENDTDEAFMILTRLVAKYPDNEQARNRFAQLQSQLTQESLRLADQSKETGDMAQYIAQLENASRYSPDATSIKRQIADFYIKESKYPQALTYYEAILEKNHSDRAILEILLQIYEKMERLDQALMVIDRLLILTPRDPVLEGKKKSIRDKFMLLNLPPKFKEIFFKTEVNREDIAALIGYYFNNFLRIVGAPVIITDIGSSFARDEIIKVASAGIIPPRPNHTFDRFSLPNRAAFAEMLNVLIAKLEKEGIPVQFVPSGALIEPTDISPVHKSYRTIHFLINAQIMRLDDEGRFNPTATLSANEIMLALQKLHTNLR